MCRNRDFEKGQSIVEAALVLPVIIFILFAVIEFGRIFSAYLAITGASREGARVAAVSMSDPEVIQAVRSAAAALNQGGLGITISPAGMSRRQGEQVVVQVDYSVDLVAPLIGSILPDPFRLTSRTVMRIE